MQVIFRGSEQGWSDKQIMDAFGVGETTIWRVRKRSVEEGLDQALNRRSQPEQQEKHLSLSRCASLLKKSSPQRTQARDYPA